MTKAFDQIKQLLDSPGAAYQMLHSCIISASYSAKKGYTSISFGTSIGDVMDATEARRKVGIIVWVDRAEFESVVKAAKQGGDHV